MKNHKLQNAIDDLKSQIDTSTKKTKFDKIVEFVEKNKEFIKIGSKQFETIHKAGDFKEEEKSRFDKKYILRNGQVFRKNDNSLCLFFDLKTIIYQKDVVEYFCFFKNEKRQLSKNAWLVLNYLINN